MIKNYLHQLKELQEDRVVFQSYAQGNKMARSLSRQEDKYQAYIIDQMASQNRIIAASNIANIVSQTVKIQHNYFFKELSKVTKNHEEQSSTSIRKKCLNNIYEESIQQCDSMTVDFMLVKLCSKVICKAAEKVESSIKKSTFSKILYFSKQKQVLSKMEIIVGKYFLRKGLQKMKQVERKCEQSYDKFFNESFSMIARQDRNKRGIGQQSYLSFMMEKQNTKVDCQTCRDSCQLVLQKEKQMTKLREELSFMKHLLAQKTLELKKKSQEINTNGVKDSQSFDNSGYTSHNSSYYSQLERQVFGGKRIRKNGSRMQESIEGSKQQISKQLLGKYMRQSFQLKESIDVAKQLCTDIQQQIPPNFRVKLQQVLKVLNQGEQVSLFDQY